MIENISLAFQGIWAHKMRSVLTMLGIIIGIAAVIAIASTIKGTNEQIKENLIGSGNNAVTVEVYQDGWEYQFDYQGSPEGVAVISDDTMQQLAAIPHVLSAARFCSRQYDQQTYYGDTAFSGSLTGIEDGYFETMGYSLCYGRLFMDSDSENCRKVAILDTEAVSVLFPTTYPIGQVLEINGDIFTIVGVVGKSSTENLDIESLSDYYMYADSEGGNVFLPLADWPIVESFDEVQNVVLRAESTDDMTDVGKQAADLLTENQITDQDSDFSYRSDDLMEQAQQLQSLSNNTNKQLLLIAGISLVVGGIGVMNIMLVTVTERRREIGLKKAIGARKRRILWQFLTEAATLTSLGGLIGVFVGIGVSRVLSTLSGTPMAISVPAGIAAVVFSMLMGIVFGMIPAVQASNLNPIDALRNE